MNKWNVASRLVGGIAAAGVLYNAHYAGNKGSAENVKTRQADRIGKYYINSRTSEDRSILTSKLKDEYFRANADWNLPDKFNALTGYIGSAFRQLAQDIIPATLATGALLSKSYAKFFGAALGVYAIKYLICDVMDLGKPNYLK